MEPSLRKLMAYFPTGVTVVATRHADGQPLGLTVNSFTSVSLEPPLVLVCINEQANSHDRLLESRSFTVNILSKGQADIAERFAKRPSEDRFDDVRWTPSPSGSPVLCGATAWLDCSIHEVVSAGDHTIVIARVEAGGSSGEPALLFHRGTLRPVGG